MPENTWTTGYAAMALPTGPSMIVGPLNGLIYSIGGITTPGSSTVEDRVYAYDYAADTWTAKASMIGRRYRCVRGIVGGKIYVLGGRDNVGGTRLTVFEYTPGTNTWASKGLGPTAHAGGGGEAIGGLIYVNYPAAGGALDAYDPVADTWTAKAASGRGAVNDSTGAVLDGFLHVFDTASTHYRYDPSANTWLLRASTGATPFLWGIVGVPSIGRIVINFGDGNQTRYTWTYNPATNNYAGKATIPTARGNQSGDQIAALVDGQFIYVIGGVSGGPVERYQIGPDPFTGLWYIGVIGMKAATTGS